MLKNHFLPLCNLIFIATLFAAVSAPADELVGRILDVHDGDTLTMQVPGETRKYKIRLLGVDTPEVDFYEKSQGEAAFAARDYLRSLAPRGAAVTVVFEANGMDKHNRILGRVIVNELELNREMLQQGWGYLYFIFPFHKKLAQEYSDLARKAVEQGRGLFSEEFRDTAAPYEFRLTARNQVGRNLVGDLDSKKLYSQENSAEIPVWARVFFPDEELARQNGYQF